MNVVSREKRSSKIKPRTKNELVRKAPSYGIRSSTLMPTSFATGNTAKPTNTIPRYQFLNEMMVTSKISSMGPPSGPPRSLKRKIANSMSSRPESSSSGIARPRVLANDSAADTSQDMCTPRNRPTALRYISSSSRGGYSGSRSARSTSTSAVQASVILALSEGRGLARREIGMAAIDLRHPHLVLCQFSDTLLYTHTLTKINYFNPIEIIVPHTFCDGAQSSQLYQLIKYQYPLLTLTTVQRRHFNDAAGRQNIQTLCAPQYSAVYLQVLHKFYALTAAAAALKYVEYIQCIVFARESLKIEYHSSEHTMIIDVGTATQLELVQPLVPSAGPSCCLLGVLGPTYTVSGIRALRALILQPSCNKEFIETRLDAVEDLINNDSGLMVDLQDVIKKLSDVDKILFLCVETSNPCLDNSGDAQLNQTLLLKTTMDIVPKLIEALNAAESGRLRKIKMDFENPNYREIGDRIKRIIQDDAHLERGALGNLQRCFAVRPDINGLLDVARRTYSELIEDIQKIVEQLSETYDLPVRLHQNMMKGFHIVLPIAPKNRRSFNVDDLPPIFIQVQFSGASVSMSTEELVVLDQQAKESLNEILKMSNIVISNLLKDLRPFMSSLYTLCENIAELDILLALAQASSAGSYIRPEFNSYLDIRNSVHPLLDYNSQVMPVPNDIYASPEQNFTIITGPNMGGKSIYIKQIAVMQIMSQIGCFIPATNAVLRLSDRIFSRIGFNDSVELNASTYVFEMKEVQHILKGLTATSLVIIDELCRGTCTEEGTSIAWAICEELLASDAFTFFTTHFMYLTRLQDLYFNVINRHTSVVEEDTTNTQNSSQCHKRLVYQHKVETGITKIENYGLALASKTNLPVDTVNLATELAELIKKNRKPEEIRSVEKSDDEALYILNAEVRKELRKSENSNESVKKLLRKFKSDNPQLMERLKAQIHSDRTDGSAYCSFSNSKHLESDNNGAFSKQSEKQNMNSKLDLHAKLQDTSNDTEDGNIVDKSNENYTLVRSTTELLNIVMDMDVDQHSNIEPLSEKISSLSSDEPKVDATLRASNFKHNNNPSNYLENNRSEITDDVIIHDNVKNVYADEESLSENDSDIADAQTQVLTECTSDDEISTSQQNSNDVMSIDEELMRETMEEINNEIDRNLANINSIILTPPMGFRDK